MKNWLKKLVCISLVAVLSTALLAGCGGKEKETESETVAETKAPESPELDACVGQVISLKSGQLMMETDDGKTLQFDVSGVNKVNRESITTGNIVAVVYSGAVVGTETDGVMVELVVALDSGGAFGDEASGLSSDRSQITGTVVEYIEDTKLVIESSGDGEYYYFSAENAVISNSVDIEEGDTVTVAYTGDLEGDELVPATRITVSASGSSTSGNGTSSSSLPENNTSGGSTSGSSIGGDTISGTVVASSMNTVTIRTSGGTRYTFSTIDAEMDSAESLKEGISVTLRYTGDLSEGAETVTVTSIEVDG